jgi:transcriptional regulator GlxA family with amidase domain
MIFLAAAGLVDYRCATTHWMAEKFIRENFPKIKLDIKRTIIDEDNIYTCGGSASFQNLVLYLIEKFMGKEYAVLVSKVMLIDINKEIQTSYAVFDYHKDHSDESILKVQNFIEENISNKLTLEELSDYSAMSQRNFIRRFRKATGENPGIYIQKARIESAKRLLEQGDAFPIEEIAFKIGYEDTGSFRNAFKKLTGVSPADYKARFNRRIEQIS